MNTDTVCNYLLLFFSITVIKLHEQGILESVNLVMASQAKGPQWQSAWTTQSSHLGPWPWGAETLEFTGVIWNLKICPQIHTSSNKAIHPNPSKQSCPPQARIQIYVSIVAILIQIITGMKENDKKKPHTFASSTEHADSKNGLGQGCPPQPWKK